jgi:hypothetical protein
VRVRTSEESPSANVLWCCLRSHRSVASSRTRHSPLGSVASGRQLGERIPRCSTPGMSRTARHRSRLGTTRPSFCDGGEFRSQIAFVKSSLDRADARDRQILYKHVGRLKHQTCDVPLAGPAKMSAMDAPSLCPTRIGPAMPNLSRTSGRTSNASSCMKRRAPSMNGSDSPWPARLYTAATASPCAHDGGEVFPQPKGAEAFVEEDHGGHVR